MTVWGNRRPDGSRSGPAQRAIALIPGSGGSIQERMTAHTVRPYLEQAADYCREVWFRLQGRTVFPGN